MRRFALTARWQKMPLAVRYLVILTLSGVLLAGSFVGGQVLGAFAQSPCARGDHAYVVVSGNTLSGIAGRYHTTWQRLASYNHIHNANLIYPDQVICIPSASHSGGGGGHGGGHTSVTSMIYQVFGAYAPSAMRVAQCESSLNPHAYNPISVGGSHAEGVFQILYPSTWWGTSQAGQSPYNAWANILAAHQIFTRDGYSWREWACQP